MMTEDLLRYFWRFKDFSSQALRTTEGEALQVLSCGTRDPEEGSDFLQAHIKIGAAHRVGSVQLQLRTSEGFKRGCSPQAGYRKCILRVVYEHDKTLVSPSGKRIPTLALKAYLSSAKIEQYRDWMCADRPIPCENQVRACAPVAVKAWLARVFSERLEEGLQSIAKRLDALIGDWEALLFERVCACFGLRINSLAFQRLARSFPFSVFRRCQCNADQLTALLYG